MSDRINNLFPTYRSGSQGAACNTTFEPFGGLTLRDLFAMAALLGLTASGDSRSAKIAAMDAYEFADAMLAEREENEE